MADNDLNKRFFTNTYITGSGRQNYLRIDDLEDPLFTSFTFDIDYVTSPLFYTINYSDYGYPNVEGLGGRIEDALNLMHAEMSNKDEGYDILPVFSASILDGNKLGFGLQQNVYMDLPLYGATEYIYMVDKRNGGADQNDARFDSNRFLESGANPNTLNSYKLGDSIKSIVNDSDKKWAERNKKQNEEQILACTDIMNDENVRSEHEANKSEMDSLFESLNSLNKVDVKIAGNGESLGEFSESEIMEKINEHSKFIDEFDYFKREIVEWANNKISGYQNRGTAIYTQNKCIQKLFAYDNLDDINSIHNELSKQFGNDYVREYIVGSGTSYYDKFLALQMEFVDNPSYIDFDKDYKQNKECFLTEKIGGDNNSVIQDHHIIEKFRDKLEYFDLLNDSVSLWGSEIKGIKGEVRAYISKTPQDWVYKYSEYCGALLKIKDFEHLKFSTNRLWVISDTMTYQCDFETAFTESFTSDKIKEADEIKTAYEMALDEIRTGLYGYENGQPCTSANPSPDSPYGQYLAAKEKYENDDYSQAEKAQKIAQSGMNEMNSMLNNDDYVQDIIDENYNAAIKTGAQPDVVSRNKSVVVSQTVLDMLGFISGMKKMTMDYPYVIQGISGLDNAYNNHYGIKDPYLGSGDNKITLTCLESLDLRVSSMFNRYFNAVYDRQYRRERVPVNLRRFNCSVYVHDVRNFVSKDRVDENGNQKITYNRLLELADMYYSVIEFRFYDCEIIPEETGNIFSDVSNEAPSEMKKTNFAFTYGNCVVNFVPQSEVAKHDVKEALNKLKNKLRKSGLLP